MINEHLEPPIQWSDMKHIASLECRGLIQASKYGEWGPTYYNITEKSCFLLGLRSRDWMRGTKLRTWRPARNPKRQMRRPRKKSFPLDFSRVTMKIAVVWQSQTKASRIFFAEVDEYQWEWIQKTHMQFLYDGPASEISWLLDEIEEGTFVEHLLPGPAPLNEVQYLIITGGPFERSHDI